MKALFAALALASVSLVGAASPACAGGTCCKVCKKGKACGDSCIAADAHCKKGKGCACNG
jgi:hypothetical protein